MKFTEDRGSLTLHLDHLVEGTVIARPNRFVAVVKVAGEARLAHVADSGRLKELIFPGNRVMVREAKVRPELAVPRKTSLDLVMAYHSGAGTGVWVSVDTRYPNRIFGEALRRRIIPEFARYPLVRSEFSLGEASRALDTGETRKPAVRSRLDFMLDGCGVKPALIEVKSVTLMRDGVGLFPDAPTERGARHLRELAEALSTGYRSYGVFIAQRSDIGTVSPNSETDPDFSDLMKEAQERGVQFLGFRCSVEPVSITLHTEPIPVVVP